MDPSDPWILGNKTTQGEDPLGKEAPNFPGKEQELQNPLDKWDLGRLGTKPLEFPTGFQPWDDPRWEFSPRESELDPNLSLPPEQLEEGGRKSLKKTPLV